MKALALVSAATDMIFPALSMLGNTPEDFDPLTVIIILTMVLLSGTLRFVQESRSGNAAEKLLAMIPCDVRILKAKVTIHHKKFKKNRHYPLFKEIQM